MTVLVISELYYKSHIECHWKNTFLPARDLSSKCLVACCIIYHMSQLGQQVKETVEEGARGGLARGGLARGGLARVSTRTTGNLASTEINF